jgi:exodeoxyribonuclease X
MLEANRTWRTSRMLAVDVEGNGDQPHELIELGVVTIVDGVIDEAGRSWLVRPQRPISDRVVAIHGITNEQVAGCPRFEDVASEVREILGQFPIVGHRVHVDREVIGRKLPSWSPAATLDTWGLARRVLPGMNSYSLRALTEHFGISVEAIGPAHRALPDAFAAARLFLGLMQSIDPGGSMTIAQLVHWAESEAHPDQMRMF